MLVGLDIINAISSTRNTDLPDFLYIYIYIANAFKLIFLLL